MTGDISSLGDAVGTGDGNGTLKSSAGDSRSFYEGEVPDFVAAELDRLHGHLLCSLSHFEVAKSLGKASTYARQRDGQMVALLLFEKHGRHIDVTSEFVRLDANQVWQFVDDAFAYYPDVQSITFRKIHTALPARKFPCQIEECSEDIVVALPATVKEYEARLGKNMRRNMKRYANALQDAYPSFCFLVSEKADIQEQDILDIIRLNRLRMEHKSIDPRIDGEETEWIIRLARECGLVGVMKIDGRVCAGAIGFRIRENYFMHVIAHAAEYDSFSAGLLCYYQTICEGILRGARRFHLMPGRYEYKLRLLGEVHPVYQVNVYRNVLAASRNMNRIAGIFLKARLQHTKQWMLDAHHRDDSLSRAVARGVHTLRNVKRSGMLSRHAWKR